jgi:hypothetical protein
MLGPVLIEGLDLTGKTSVCLCLIRKIDPPIRYQKNIFRPENEVFDFAVAQQRRDIFSLTSVGYMYLAALHADLDKLVWEDDRIVQDSSMALRLCAYFMARRMDDLASAFQSCLELPNYPKFKKAFLFTADLTERRRRLKKRLVEAPDTVTEDDLLLENDPDLALRNEKILLDLTIKYTGATVVDTTLATVNEIIAYLIDMIAPEDHDDAVAI